ncbi:hypothetical protein BS78_K325100 [Paspalum vaginatum]|uniref:Uncharacterized protein n=1 Tax=Paspalum vaginatum TaxID=158149 RepID=A0A9W8CEH7_9POAL|nr:hypothetical protein BS78_K325100 [Paspalum vaginatum]
MKISPAQLPSTALRCAPAAELNPNKTSHVAGSEAPPIADASPRMPRRRCPRRCSCPEASGGTRWSSAAATTASSLSPTSPAPAAPSSCWSAGASWAGPGLGVGPRPRLPLLPLQLPPQPPPPRHNPRAGAGEARAEAAAAEPFILHAVP